MLLMVYRPYNALCLVTYIINKHQHQAGTDRQALNQAGSFELKDWGFPLPVIGDIILLLPAVLH